VYYACNHVLGCINSFQFVLEKIKKILNLDINSHAKSYQEKDLKELFS
jgi:hypothetical protein